MEHGNQTTFTEFILVGFSENMTTCVFFFAALLFMYIFTIFANIFLISLVISSTKLHLPMYFFLCNLSFLDLCYSSSSVPKVLVDIFSRKRTISRIGCMVQMNTGTFLGGTVCWLLAVMAYDRYVAICLPLYYIVIFNWKICRYIIVVMWSGCFLLSVVPSISKPLIFCKENKLDHFVCEMLAVLEIACGNVSFYKLTIFVMSLFTLVGPLIFILVSYILIISSILKISTNERRSKAFSTCASHLIVVSMFYGTSITMYMGQTKRFFSNLKYISLTYGIITPVLNPLIYSLRNTDVKKAFKMRLGKVIT